MSSSSGAGGVPSLRSLWQRVEQVCESSGIPGVENKLSLLKGLYSQVTQQAVIARGRVDGLKGMAVERCCAVKSKGLEVKERVERQAGTAVCEVQKHVVAVVGLDELRSRLSALRLQAGSAVDRPAAVVSNYRAAAGTKVQALRARGEQSLTTITSASMQGIESVRQQFNLHLSAQAPRVHAYVQVYGTRGAHKVAEVARSIRSLQASSVEQLHTASTSISQTVILRATAARSIAIQTKTTAVERSSEAVQQSRKVVRQFLAERFGDDKAQQVMGWVMIPTYFL
jgi:hypothetical protein